MTGVNRGTVGSLALRVGLGCMELHDRLMVGIRTERLSPEKSGPLPNGSACFESASGKGTAPARGRAEAVGVLAFNLSGSNSSQCGRTVTCSLREWPNLKWRVAYFGQYRRRGTDLFRPPVA